MTENRFTYLDASKNHYIGSFFYNGVPLTNKEVVDLLNENEQLKQSYIQLKHRHSLLHDECLDAECDRDGYHKDVLSLEKENGKLKSEIEKLSYANEDLLSEKRNWQRMSDEYCKLSEENDQLKQQLQKIQNSFEFNCTQNYVEFNKDKLYIKDNNTEIRLDGTNLFIEVYIPQIDEYNRFKYMVTGRRLMERIY